MEEPLDEKRMRLRYAGTCRICRAEIPARTEAVYERSTKTVRCLSHDETAIAHEPSAERPQSQPEVHAVDAGTPGASARREFERRRQAREDRERAKHPKLGGLLLALRKTPQSTTSWDTGALGEERLGQRLSELCTDSLLVLHDRKIPRSRANIDHIAVTPTGVWVIDAKKYRGRPALKVGGGILRQRTEKLVVGSRDCTTLVDGVLKQVGVVEDVLLPGGRPEGPGRPWGGVPVHGVLCFIEADWPLIGGAFTIRGVDVLWPKKLYPRLRAEGRLTASDIAEIHRHLAKALRPA
ncbi:nuclease-related domain-containing protein [Nocardioides halotolerans]|uniref:nuclease-related domain-containing protein n=1 Tax=Nocardioides halotolerans TaxID=433660 RepID=UPI00048D1DC3|nr:nuclease-related domain-containing protein [Nocardioides halotolerans]